MSSLLLDQPPLVPSRVHGISSAITLLGMLFPIHHPRPSFFLLFCIPPRSTPPFSLPFPSAPMANPLSREPGHHHHHPIAPTSSQPAPPPLHQPHSPSGNCPALLSLLLPPHHYYYYYHHHTIDIPACLLLKFEPKTRCAPPADKQVTRTPNPPSSLPPL